MSCWQQHLTCCIGCSFLLACTENVLGCYGVSALSSWRQCAFCCWWFLCVFLLSFAMRATPRLHALPNDLGFM
ncbi:unnamed protein product [Symbiodinium pilosum]|uniref:Uncharacterized protein n=1 Tax=Symbiodinium pilosum TaxID=2952 RepID=A0A812TJL0_SYMPI|nr:unnamed protein product [Symbiodinium pilosum]